MADEEEKLDEKNIGQLRAIAAAVGMDLSRPETWTLAQRRKAKELIISGAVLKGFIPPQVRKCEDCGAPLPAKSTAARRYCMDCKHEREKQNARIQNARRKALRDAAKKNGLQRNLVAP